MNDQMKARELLPCPFCSAAHESLMIEHLEGTILHPAYRVLCDNCGASSGYTDKCCRESWNTRAALRTAPEGYVLVPVEPTDKILDSLFDRDLTGAHDDDLRATYDAVIAAAMEGR